MAARKSCTKLTWDEAKAKVGGSNANTDKRKPAPKNINHGDALTAKVIAKHGASQQEISQQKSLSKKTRRDQERALAAASRREEERERERADQVVKPHEQARRRLKELALQLAALSPETSTITTRDVSLSDLKRIAECKQIQLDEIVALEAIFTDTEEFLVSEASNLEDLRRKIEDYQMNEEKELLLRTLAEHPPLSFYIQLTINSSIDLVASVLLHVTYPQLYPLGGSTPHYEIDYFMVTDRTAICSADKPLESLAYLEATGLRDALNTESGQILPDPCVYEVAVSWLSDNLFDFVAIHTHGQLSTKK